MKKIVAVIVLLIPMLVYSQDFPKDKQEGLKWVNGLELHKEGQGWKSELNNNYVRFPKHVKEKLRPEVWNLSRNSAGLCIYFKTNSNSIHVKWALKDGVYLPHMASTGVKGVDLYIKSEGRWQFASVAQPRAKINNEKIIGNLGTETKECLINLPLYDGVDDLYIGVDENSIIEKHEGTNKKIKPIVVYGTSITQGGCASRPGMAYTSQLSRALNIEFINLGFSGNGRMMYPVSDVLSELEPSLFIIDCLPNIGSGKELREKAPSFIKNIRKQHPEVPILFVENVIFDCAKFDKHMKSVVEGKNSEWKKIFDELSAEESNKGYLYYMEVEEAHGGDNESTVDGIHLTDLGFKRLAELMKKKILKIIKL
jgi:lysophospholipase L1-like esterase